MFRLDTAKKSRVRGRGSNNKRSIKRLAGTIGNSLLPLCASIAPVINHVIGQESESWRIRFSDIQSTRKIREQFRAGYD